MKNTCKKLIKKLIYGYRASSESYRVHLNSIGMCVGAGTEFIDPRSTNLDETRPWMIKVGKGCCITPGVTILTHDYGWSVMKAVYGEVIGSAAPVSIGDNVYIGSNTTVIGGVTVGDNVIIGANSLVSRSIPDNCVAAGNPARVIRSLDAYHEKRKQSELTEAVVMVNEYRKQYGVNPPLEVMREHFWLFSDCNDDLNELFKDVNRLVYGSTQLTEKVFSVHKKQFKDYNAFLEYCSCFEAGKNSE